MNATTRTGHDGRVPARAGLLSRLGNWAGLGPGLDLARDVRSLGRRPAALLGAGRRLLGENLEGEKALLEGDFSRTLRCWRLSEEDLPAYVEEKRRERACGIGLALFSLLAAALHLLFPQGGLMPRALAAAAILSMACCGGLLALASSWRIAVCRRRRFVPFLAWLKGLATGEGPAARPRP